MTAFPSVFDAIDDVLLSGDETRIKELPVREGCAEVDYLAARAALNQRNLQYGFQHTAELLKYDPSCKEWLDLLEVYLLQIREDDVAAVLTPEGKERYYANEAVRAYILHKGGRIAEAVQILVAIDDVVPGAGYLQCWGLDWLRSVQALEIVERDVYVHVLAGPLFRHGEYNEATRQSLEVLDGYLALMDVFRNAFDEDDVTLMIRAGLLRKAGRFDEALEICRSNVERFGGLDSHVSLGLVLGEQGDRDGAEAAFRTAFDADPENGLPAAVGLADLYFDYGEWALAIDWYNKVLQLDGMHRWSEASIIYCEWRMSGSQEAPKSLVEFAARHSDDYRANMLLNEFRLYKGQLPRPADALAKVLEADAMPTDGTLTLTALEAPSNMTALRLMSGRDMSSEIRVQSVPEPDPREAIVSGDYTLWSYEGTKATPLLQEPKESITKMIADIACRPLHQAWSAASRVAAGLSDDNIEGLLAAMAHPPAIPEGIHVLDWLPRIQYIALAIIANLAGPWRGSQRREALLSVLLGARDWTTNAAIIVLADLAEKEPVVALDVHLAFEKLQEAIPREGACGYEFALYYNWRKLSLLTDEEREQVRGILNEIQGA